MRAAGELHKIKPGDVFHDAPAAFNRFPAPVYEAQPDKRIARGARPHATRARDITRRQRANRRLALRSVNRAMIHRLEGENLLFARQQSLNLAQRRARPCAHHKFCGLVKRDSAQALRGENAIGPHRATKA